MTSIQLERPASAHPTFLIVGYGNELQGDRGIGPRVARTVASWDLPFVKAIVAHELVPELATHLAEADDVIFVDACEQLGRVHTVQLSPISLGIDNPHLPASSTHSHSARGLLALTQEIYNYAPQAWMLQTPAESFVCGQPLSSTAVQSCDRAIVIIERFLSNYSMATYSADKPAQTQLVG